MEYLDFEIVPIDQVAEQDLSYEFDIDNIDNDIDEALQEVLQDIEATIAVAEILEELGYSLA